MICDNCKYRYKCYTVPDKSRPQIVNGVRWQPALRCGMCSYGEFKKKKKRGAWGWFTVLDPVGKCTLHNYVVHQYSASCNDFVGKTSIRQDKVKKGLMQALKKRKNRFRLPTYCVDDNEHK